MKKQNKVINNNTLKSVYIDCICAFNSEQYFNENTVIVSSATGFYYKYKEKMFLVTNKHVVTGKNTFTNECLSKMQAIPTALRVETNFNILNNDNSNETLNVTLVYDLYKNIDTKEEPIWYVYNDDLMVDLAILDVTDEYHKSIENIKQIRNCKSCDWYYYKYNNKNRRLNVSDNVFVVGFPFGYQTTGFDGCYAIWNSGFVASESNKKLVVPIHNLKENEKFSECDAFLIDAYTRYGQSGSPVISKTHNKSFDLIGIYSGRTNKDSTLGYVWKIELINKIIEQTVNNMDKETTIRKNKIFGKLKACMCSKITFSFISLLFGYLVSSFFIKYNLLSAAIIGLTIFVLFWIARWFVSKIYDKMRKRYKAVCKIIESLKEKNNNVISELRNILKSDIPLNKEFDENDDTIYIWYLLDNVGLADLKHSGLGNNVEIELNCSYKKEIVRYLRRNKKNIKNGNLKIEGNDKVNTNIEKEWLLEQQKEKKEQGRLARTIALSGEIKEKNKSIYDIQLAVQLIIGIFLAFLSSFFAISAFSSYSVSQGISSIDYKYVAGSIICFAIGVFNVSISYKYSKSESALIGIAGLIMTIMTMMISPVFDIMLNQEYQSYPIIIYQNEQSCDDINENYSYISKLNVGNLIPNDAKYIKIDGTVINNGESFPSDFENGDIYQLPNCTYEYNEDFGIWVQVNKDVK